MGNLNNQFEDANSHEIDEEIGTKYWSELGVKVGANKDKSVYQLVIDIKSKLKVFPLQALKELAELLGVEIEEGKKKENLLDEICKLSSERLLYLINLMDFMNRKKKTINFYFDQFSIEKTYTNHLCKLIYFIGESPAHLFAIKTLNIWQNHASGVLYGNTQKIKFKEVENIVREYTYEDSLVNKLHKYSGGKHKYKIHSYCKIDDEYIIEIYKQLDDISKEDFNQAIRNQTVSRVLFSIKTSQNIVEIKTKAKFEESAIKEYIEEVCDVELNVVEEEVYDQYDQEKVKRAFVEGITPTGEMINDFLVDKISFRDSPLENSPFVTISLDNMDVMKSVHDASIKGAIDFKSIKSIASLSLRASDTRRTISSTVLDNGDIFFQMDDSRLSKTQKDNLKSKFLARFGLPLYRRISNVGTIDGDVDLVDYILNNAKNLGSDGKKKQQELETRKILERISVIKSYCVDGSCGYEEILMSEEEKPEECPYCEDDVRIKREDKNEINTKATNKFIKDKFNKLSNFAEWKYLDKSKSTIDGVKFEFLKLEKDNVLFKILIIYEAIPTKTFNKMKNLIEPTLIVLVGQPRKNIERYLTSCFSSITFGDLFERDLASLNELMTSELDMLNKKTKSFVSEAAFNANTSIKNNVTDPKANNYLSTDLEDDTYVLLKDLFINVQKWGHEKTGEEYPEGLFTLYFKDVKGVKTTDRKMAYSYDCKLNTDLQGFNFTTGERDKAKRYIKRLSESMELKDFTNSNYLDGHIFISNKFKEKNVENTYKKIRKSIQEYYNTEIIFLETDALIYLHEKYSEYYSLFETSRETFNLLLSRWFEKGQGEILTKDSISKLIDKTLRYAERNAVDFKEIDKDLIDSLL